MARFTHNFIIYEENTLPERFRGQLFGIEPLQGQVVLSNFKPYQSSFETEDIERVLKTDDPWFRPVDIKTGPDGDIYIADMYEQRIDHSSHYAGRVDKKSGRIYKLTGKGTKPAAATFDYAQLSDVELLRLLDHPGKWHRQMAVKILGDRFSPGSASALQTDTARRAAVVKQLETELAAATGQSALERLWALNACGGLSDPVALRLLRHNEPFVRAWTVRIVCDPGTISPDVGTAIAHAASQEPYIDVRKQMACSARRLSPELALPIIRELLKYDEDANDIHQPLLVLVGHRIADQPYRSANDRSAVACGTCHMATSACGSNDRRTTDETLRAVGKSRRSDQCRCTAGCCSGQGQCGSPAERV